jgi:hypothetical protein
MKTRCTKPVRAVFPRLDAGGGVLSDSQPQVAWVVKLIYNNGESVTNLFQSKRDARAFRKLMHNREFEGEPPVREDRSK